MKLIKKSLVSMSSILIIATIIIGCSSTGMERSQETSTTMETMGKDIKNVLAHIDVLGLSLKEITNNNQKDVKESFDKYSDNVEKIESLEKQFAKHADEMKSRGKEYFKEWEKEGNDYKNPEIQALSEQRRNNLSEVYGMIAQNSIGVKDAFRAYVSDIKEIQIYLTTDLTTRGIEAITPISNKAVRDGDNLKYAIKNVQSAIDRARSEMVQTGM